MKNWIYGFAYFSNGETKYSRKFVDEKAFSRWANAQFRKDEQVTINEYEMDRKTYNIRKVATWHA